MKYKGKTAQQAVTMIRGLRPRSVETQAQEESLTDFEKYLNQVSSSECHWTVMIIDNPALQKKVFLQNFIASTYNAVWTSSNTRPEMGI